MYRSGCSIGIISAALYVSSSSSIEVKAAVRNSRRGLMPGPTAQLSMSKCMPAIPSLHRSAARVAATPVPKLCPAMTMFEGGTFLADTEISWSRYSCPVLTDHKPVPRSSRINTQASLRRSDACRISEAAAGLPSAHSSSHACSAHR